MIGCNVLYQNRMPGSSLRRYGWQHHLILECNQQIPHFPSPLLPALFTPNSPEIIHRQADEVRLDFFQSSFQPHEKESTEIASQVCTPIFIPPSRCAHWGRSLISMNRFLKAHSLSQKTLTTSSMSFNGPGLNGRYRVRLVVCLT